MDPECARVNTAVSKISGKGFAPFGSHVTNISVCMSGKSESRRNILSVSHTF